MICIGIDLGYRGALVALDDLHRPILVRDTPLKGTRHSPRGYDVEGFARVVAEACALPPFGLRRVVVMETPTHVRVGPTLHAQATGVLFLGAGLWLGAFAAHDIVVEPVPATTWHRDMLKGVPGTSTKDRAAFIARLLGYPELVVNDGRADAACIAEWARTRGLPLLALDS